MLKLFRSAFYARAICLKHPQLKSSFFNHSTCQEENAREQKSHRRHTEIYRHDCNIYVRKLSPMRHVSSHDAEAVDMCIPGSSSSRLIELCRGVEKRHDSLDTKHARVILGLDTSQPIRTRFAPSPTGYPHLGSLRTALFNNLAAVASRGGAFVLRLEDTDRTRLIPDAEERIIKDLRWAGLAWNEGPDLGGPFGPYRQSERLAIYEAHARHLIDRGRAYRCFCTREQLRSEKLTLHGAGRPLAYSKRCRYVPSAESDLRAAAGEPHVVRFKSGSPRRSRLKDAIYGQVAVDVAEDVILMKMDRFPSYHFANVIDDHLMKISLVMRGEEWLISTPLHLLLYDAFRWEPPTFAHLGLLVNSDGRKLSKRSDSVALSTYQSGSTLPIALLAWLANLGSSFLRGARMPGTLAEMADAMTFKFTRGGIHLNPAKLAYFQRESRELLFLQDRELTPEETKLMDHCCIQPMLSEVEQIAQRKKEQVERMPVNWKKELEFVPCMTHTQGRNHYIRKLLQGKDGCFRSPQTFIYQHCYLFWRVPEALYRKSLAEFPPDSRILKAVNQAIEERSSWEGQGAIVFEGLLTQTQKASISQRKLHSDLRLIATGNPMCNSQSSIRMLELLGMNEWRHRLDVVRSILVTMKPSID